MPDTSQAHTGQPMTEPLAIDPLLTDGKPMRLDHVLSKAAPWMRTLQETLAKDRAGVAEIVRGLCGTEDGAKHLGDMLDNWESLAGAFDELADLLRLGHDRIAIVCCELSDGEGASCP